MQITLTMVVAAIVILISGLVVITIFGGGMSQIGGLSRDESACQSQCEITCSSVGSLPNGWYSSSCGSLYPDARCLNGKCVTQDSSASMGGITSSFIPELQELQPFRSAFQVEILSEEECRNGLTERKESLGIPDELCYWEAMTEVYDEKCDNLDKEQISAIFEKKEEYRNLMNEDWPSLKTQGDYCVPVVYDCDEWSRWRSQYSNTAGYFNHNTATIEDIMELSDLQKEMVLEKLDISVKELFLRLSVTGNEAGEIVINPFRDMSYNSMKQLLLHESLHSIQSIIATTTLFLTEVPDSMEGNGDNVWIEFFKIFPEYRMTFDKHDRIISKMKNLVKGWEKELRNGKEDLDTKQLEESVGEFDDYFDNIFFANDFYFDYISDDNMFKDKMEESAEWKAYHEELHQVVESEKFKDMKSLFHAYSNSDISSFKELDPRLSEVHRWWFDQTEPENCEIIETPKRAKEVLKLFLAEEHIADEYGYTQKDMRYVMEVAERLERTDEIYELLATRLIGLASAEPIDDGTVVA